MADRLVDVKTPATKEEIFVALWAAWIQLFNEVPKRESILILMSQWALETGWGRYMHCFNFGNVKSYEGDSYDYCYFACNEILKKAVAEKYVANNPATAKITQYRNDGTAIIWFYPDHSGCRFRAFHTILEGALDHISIVSKRFAKSWPAVLAGDPKQYSHMLRQQGYYTADESTYTATLTSVFNGLKKLPFNADALPKKPVTESSNEITEVEKARIMSLVTMTMASSYEESTHSSWVPSDDDEENA